MRQPEPIQHRSLRGMEGKMLRSTSLSMAAAGAVTIVVGLASPSHAQSHAVGSVTMVRTGWNADSFAIVTAEPIMNPARCPTPDGYISDKSFPGYGTYYAAALTAIAARRRVIVAINDTECFAGRPKILGVNLTSE